MIIGCDVLRRPLPAFFLSFSVMGSLLILALLVPLVVILISSSPADVVKSLRDSEVVGAIIVSMSAATLATCIALIFGVPLAYVFARKEFRLKSLLESIVEFPIVVPHSVAGIMILLAYHSRTPIGHILSNLGVAIEDSFWGITAAMLFVSAPILVSTVRAGFSLVDESYEHVARTLGASQLKVFFTISLPLAFRSVLSGAILTWARSISEVGAILIIAPYPKSAAVLVLERFEAFGLTAAKPLTVLLVVISLAIFVLLRLITKR